MHATKYLSKHISRNARILTYTFEIEIACLAARLKGIPPKDCFLSFDKLQTLWNVFTVLCAMYVFCCKISSSVSKSLYGVRMEPIFYQFLEGSLRAFIL